MTEGGAVPVMGQRSPLASALWPLTSWDLTSCRESRDRKVRQAGPSGRKGKRAGRAGGRALWTWVCSLMLKASAKAHASAPSARSRAWGWTWASFAREGHLVDALAPRGDEGRGTLRKAQGRGERSLILGCPNGATHRREAVSFSESIAGGGEPGELKHLSSRRKGKQLRLRK